MRTAFSLVELSIVLVILGLLTGGILAGQSLIRASELRAVGTEFNRYLTATQSFRDRYFQLPGDFSAATKIWGDNNSYCADGAITNGTPGTCNGNGDSQIAGGAANTSTEGTQFWNHLALAGLIEGTYSGIAGPDGNNDAIPGVNIPSSKLNNGLWHVRYMGVTTSGWGTWWYTMNYGQMLSVGADVTSSWPYGAIIRPEEMWNIDVKYDDGIPGRGKVIAGSRNTCTLAASDTDFSAAYNLSSTAMACVPAFIHVF